MAIINVVNADASAATVEATQNLSRWPWALRNLHDFLTVITSASLYQGMGDFSYVIVVFIKYSAKSLN